MRSVHSSWIAVILFLSLVSAGCASPAARTLDIYWVDVEGGAATLIVTPAGESICVDTGMPGERDPRRISELARNVAGLERIDHLVITHFDIDHFGGAPDLSKLIPIGKLYDHGGSPGERHAPREAYLELRASRHVVLKPGDSIPLRQSSGTPEVSLTCLAAAQKFLPPGPQHKANEDICGKAQRRDADPSENANSIVLCLQFGRFGFLDAADLTWNLEEQLVCPVNLVGEMDVYQVNHHGLDFSNNPVLIRSVGPTVAVMNNGERKGCNPGTFQTLKSVESIEALYQVHKNLRREEHNTDPRWIANTGPSRECQANHIKLSVTASGEAYSVSIPATGHVQEFQSKGP